MTTQARLKNGADHNSCALVKRKKINDEKIGMKNVPTPD
jgi:hypothetical protein